METLKYDLLDDCEGMHIDGKLKINLIQKNPKEYFTLKWRTQASTLTGYPSY